MAAGLRQRTRCHTVSFSRQCEEAAVETSREDRGSQTEEQGFEVVREAATKDEDQPSRTLEECVAVMKSEVRNSTLWPVSWSRIRGSLWAGEDNLFFIC